MKVSKFLATPFLILAVCFLQVVSAPVVYADSNSDAKVENNKKETLSSLLVDLDAEIQKLKSLKKTEQDDIDSINKVVSKLKARIDKRKIKEAFLILLLVMVAGAFGGFVDGLTTNNTYKVTLLKGKKTDIGFLGDMLVGAIASVAIFTVAGSIFKLSEELNDIWNAPSLIKIFAWCALSGYAGIRLLNPLSKKMVKQLAGEAARDTVKSRSTENAEVTLSLKDAQDKLNDYAMKKDELIEAKKYEKVEELLDTALNKYDLVTDVEPLNKEALRGKARIFRRKAELAIDQGKDAANYWSKAIELLKQIVDNDPNAALSYYSLACIRSLSKGKDEDIIADLEKAIEIQPKLKETARLDVDFERLRKGGNLQLLKLVGKVESTEAT